MTMPAQPQSPDEMDLHQKIEQKVQKASAYLGENIMPNIGFRDQQELAEDKDLIKEIYKYRLGVYLKVKALMTKEKRAAENEKTTLLLEKKRMADMVRGLNNLEKFLQNEEQKGPNSKLRPHQIPVLKAILAFLEKGKRKGFIKFPTGGGKTAMFIFLAEALGLKTLVYMPRETLLGQTEESFEKFAPEITVEILSEEKKGKKEPVSAQHEAMAALTTYQLLNTEMRAVENGKLQENERRIKPEEYGLEICDEGHRMLGNQTSKNVLAHQGSLRFAFTATPDFSEAEGRRLSDYLEEIYSLSIQDAVEQKAIAPFRTFIISTNVNLDDVAIRQGDFDEKELQKKIDQKARNMAAINLYLGFPNDPAMRKQLEDNNMLIGGKKVVAYCCGVKHAENVAKLFQENGVSATFISGKMSSEEKKKILNDFKNGVYKVLANADLLIEGFDDPEVIACFNLRPSFSPVVVEQRGGRVLRTNAADPQKIGMIFDFMDQSARQMPLTFAEVIGATEVLGKDNSPNPAANGDEDGSEGGEGDGDIDELPKPKIEDEILKLGDIEIYLSEESIQKALGKRLENQAKAGIVPAGWFAFESYKVHLASTMGLPQAFIQKMANEILQNSSLRGCIEIQKTTYCSPIFIQNLRAALEKECIPDDFVELDEIANEMVTKKLAANHDKALEEIMAAIELSSMPNSLLQVRQGYKKGVKRMTNFCSPKIAKELKETLFFTSYRTAPKNWKPLNSYYKGKGAEAFVQSVLGTLQNDFPDLIQTYLHPQTKKAREFVSPFGAFLLKINSQTIPDFADRFHTTTEYLNRFLAALHSQNPALFGEKEMTFTPKVADEIHQLFKATHQFPKAMLETIKIPDKFHSPEAIIDDVFEEAGGRKTDLELRKMITKRLSTLMLENADQVRIFRNSDGKIGEFVHENILAELLKTKAIEARIRSKAA